MGQAIRYALAVTGVLAICLFAGRLVHRSSLNHPQVSLISPDQDTLVPGQLEYTLRVQNTGGRRLVIHQMDTHCDCGAKVLQSIIVPPGQTIAFLVPLNGISHDDSTETLASFTTNDPTCARFELRPVLATNSLQGSLPSQAIRLQVATRVAGTEG